MRRLNARHGHAKLPEKGITKNRTGTHKLWLDRAREVSCAQKYNRVFDTLPEVNDRDLEMFTILGSLSSGYCGHCAETYLLAKTKIEKRLASGVVLRNLFEREFVSTDEFFVRVCFMILEK